MLTMELNIFRYSFLYRTPRVDLPSKTVGAIHSTKVLTGPTGKSGPPQMDDHFFRNFSGWTEPIHRVLEGNFRKFWLNGSRPVHFCKLNFLSNGPSARSVDLQNISTEWSSSDCRIIFSFGANFKRLSLETLK